MRMVRQVGRCVVTGALLAGCIGDGDGRARDRADPRPPPRATDEPLDSGETGTEPGSDALLLGGIVTCAEPFARLARRYDTEYLDVAPPGPMLIEGGGLVVADLDDDGLLDLLAAGAPPKLFRGADGGRTFVEDAAALQGLDIDGMVGGSAADYDGDGDLDLFLTRWNRPDVLLRNDGGALADVTAAAGVGGPGLAGVSSAWDDYDGDGDLDLVVGRYGETPDLLAEQMQPGDPSSLYRNVGDGTFDDVSHLLPPQVQDAYKFMTAWYDLDEDGDRELFSVHDFGFVRQSRMLRNDGGTLVLDDSAGFHPDYEGMGLGVGDVNRDAHPDFLQTSSRRISLLVSLETDASDTGVVYVESAAALGMVLEVGTASYKGQDWGWGAELGDVDDDGDLDAVATFGAWDTYFGSPVERDALFLLEDGAFTEVAGRPEWTFDWTASTRGLLLVDLDGDGYLDVVRNALDGPLRIDRARCGPEAWVEVALDDALVPANRHGIGARIEVLAGGVRQWGWIDSGSTSLFTGGPPVAHFGLGGARRIERLCVTWPDGDEDCHAGIEPRQRIVALRR